MDKVFICVLAVFTIAAWITETEGAGEGLSLGIAVRQGEPSGVITQKNGELLLNCSVDFEKELGPLSIRWTRDGEPVDLSTKRILQLENGSLYFRRVIHRPKKERSDGGRYRCLATLDKVGTVIAREVQVQVAGIDRKFEIEPKPQLVPLGGVARFQCKIQAVPPAMYLWERNGTMLPQNNNRYLILSSGILQITGVNELDVGRYKCYVTQGSLHRLPGNDIDTKYSSEAALEIDPVSTSNQVKIVASSKNETALVGSSALLECLVQGSVKVEWMKNGQSLTLHRGMERIGNNLHFLETELSDSGQYQCVAGNVMVSMMLNIIQKPVIREVPESRTYLKDQWIYLECDVGGKPKPTITWLKDGHDIPIMDKRYTIKEDQLVITFSKVSNSGYYQCIATSPAGSTMGFTRLKILPLGDEPEKPTNVTAISVTKSDIHIVWNAAITSADSRIVAYTVHYIKTGDIENLNEVTPQTQIHLKELSPFSEYTINVAAYTQKGGQGPMSDPLVVRTLEDVPSKPPTISMAPGSTSILVTWALLPARDRLGNIVGYKLYYRRKGEKQAIELKVSGTALEYEINGLEPKTDYEVRLNAGTSAGYHSFSDTAWPWVYVRTMDDMDVQLNIDSVNATAINVTWICERNTQWKQFFLEVRHPQGDSVVQSLTLSQDVRYYIISGLEENTIYEIILDVERVDGRTGQVVEEFRTSNVPLPPTPRSVHHTLVTATSIGVAWVQADSKMGITHFTVRYSRLGSGNDNTGMNTVTSDSSSALLERLRPFTQYHISVQAHSVHTASKFSSPLIVRTKEGVPSEPQNIQIETVKPGHINVEWSPPAKPNGQIKSYIIMYASSLTDDEETWVKVLKNGTEHSAIITITQTGGQPGMLYFKLLASTTEGPGTPSPPISINTAKVTMPVTGEEGPTGEEQRTGIIIGISIGGFCIIVCIFIICCRHRILSSSYNQQPQTQPARFHGNGHIPGNGNGHAVPMGVENHRTAVGEYELEAYTPMLEHLPENEDSDSKGGGGGNVILTPNGTKLNGFVPMKKNGICNGAIQNGHMTSFISNEYNGEKLCPEETRGLIASMLSGGSEHCMTTHGGEDSFPSTRYEDLGSLDDIDRSSCEDVLGNSQEQDSTGEDSRAASRSASDGHSVRYSDSIPRSDTTDTGDTVVCAISGCPQLESDTDSPPPGGEGQDEGGAEEGTLVSRNEIPHSPLSPGSSSTCEDTCHDGGTNCQVSQAGSDVPQFQLTTSTCSQALRSPPSHERADHVTGSSSSNTTTPQASPAYASWGSAAGAPGHGTAEPVPDVHSTSSSNGFPPQLCCSRGQTQGETRITSAEHNPSVPRTPQTGEVSLSHGARETTLDKTLAQVPQDADRAAAANSSWKHHYQV